MFRAVNQERRRTLSFIRFVDCHRNLTKGCADISERELNSEMKIKMESHWRDKLTCNEFKPGPGKEKFYVLSMFPYPSGHLHMGHVRVYSISDSMARFHRMTGKNVLHPMGWDAFGLPAENAAIQRNIPADVWTRENIKHMKEQLQSLGCSFDWTRELSTCYPDYFKWTQDLFIKLFDNGLAYQKEAMVNWDPVDKTVLAEEQVDANGRSWRSGAKVEKKLLKQWFIRTTKFSKPLYDGLSQLNADDWKDIIKVQKHWIGECNGFTFDMKVSGMNPQIKILTVWTETPEYLLDDCFIGVRNSHILNNSSNSDYLSELTVVNPFTRTKIPVIVTDNLDYPMGRSGSLNEVYLGIPGYRKSDLEVAAKFKLPINSLGRKVNKSDRESVLKQAQDLKIGGYAVSSKLQDWLISRQRHWGTPIPIIHCSNCGAVPDRNIPVVMDKPLVTNCPKCGREAHRETDTMDTFVDSSWYFLRYLDPQNNREMFDKNLAHEIMPVDLYIGGKEHAELHLYYARFINHFLHSLKLVPEKEPFQRLLTQGMVMGRSFRVKDTGKYISEEEVKIVDLKKNKGIEIATGKSVVIQWEKMSKSKQNGVDPAKIINEYGCDTTRLFILGNVAPMSHRNWTTDTFPGILNWQKRIWMTIHDLVEYRKGIVPTSRDNEEDFVKNEEILLDSRNYYISGATFHFKHTQHISSAISNMQGLTNFLRRAPKDVIKYGAQFELSLAAQIIMIAPLAPHFASECWFRLANAPNKINTDNSIINWDLDVLSQRWPEVNQDYGLEFTIYINGEELKTLKVPRKRLDVLTLDSVSKIAEEDKEVAIAIGSNEIRHRNFKLYPGCHADLYLAVKRPQKQKQEINQ